MIDIEKLEGELSKLQKSHEGDRTKLIDTLNDLAWNIRHKDSDRASELAEQALVESQKSPVHIYGQAYSLCIKASLETRSDLANALVNVKKAIKLNKVIQNKTLITKTHGILGQIYSISGDYSRALEYYLHAKETAEEIGAEILHFATLHNIGLLHSDTGDFRQAINILSDAMDLAKKMGFLEGQYFSAFNLSTVYSRNKQFEEANELVNDLIELCGDDQYHDLFLSCFTLKAEISYDMGNFADALTTYESLLDTKQSLNSHLKSDVLLGYAKSLYRKKTMNVPLRFL